MLAVNGKASGYCVHLPVCNLQLFKTSLSLTNSTNSTTVGNQKVIQGRDLIKIRSQL